MQIIKNPKPEKWQELLKRPAQDDTSLDDSVKKVLDEIKNNGDKAVYKYTKQFDKVALQSLTVTGEEITDAYGKVNKALKEAIGIAIKNIEKFHIAQKQTINVIETMPGIKCWQKSVAIENVGLYVPGGTAPLFSTVLMLGIPALIAGCNNIVLCTPPDKDGNIHPAILYAANLIGIKQIYRVGGIQAIGAMAYGTETIPKVNKIFGPGNRYVTTAKQIVSRNDVAIDMPAGPSEVAVMADKSCNPSFVASDLLSQAEHGEDSQVILVSTDEMIITQVQAALNEQINKLSRKEMAAKAMQHSKAFIMENTDQMISMINEYAPEHLIISLENTHEVAEKIINAGSVFLGNYTPESAGDYASGTNHTLPTNGFAKAYNGVNLDDFVKKITFQELSKNGLFSIGKQIAVMAETENLDAHSNAVRIRLNEIDKQNV
jgi:histidinol dehydrogenase